VCAVEASRSGELQNESESEGVRKTWFDTVFILEEINVEVPQITVPLRDSMRWVAGGKEIRGAAEMPLPLFVSFPLTSYDLSNLQGFAVPHYLGRRGL
jgi:hypothetical protein